MTSSQWEWPVQTETLILSQGPLGGWGIMPTIYARIHLEKSCEYTTVYYFVKAIVGDFVKIFKFDLVNFLAS